MFRISQWPDPYTFKPERFAADKQAAKRDIWSFSTGPRVWYFAQHNQ
jgi:cytochrome P450